MMIVDHKDLSDEQLHYLLRSNEIEFAGNKRLKIYGHLHCKSGKRMSRENRVFFSSEEEAIALGYRPCGHCMAEKYHEWREHHEPTMS